MLLAEGERSSSCVKLGFTKNVDRFSTAIGLVLNLEREAEPHKERSFTVRPIDPTGKQLAAAGVGFEFAE